MESVTQSAVVYGRVFPGPEGPGFVSQIKLIRAKELHEILQDALALPRVARVMLPGVVAHLLYAVTAEHLCQIVAAGFAEGFDVRLGQLDVILKSEQPIPESERLVLADAT